MKWHELEHFTWTEVSALTWAEIKEDQYTLLQKLWNREITLSPIAEKKLLALCEPFVEEYQRHCGQKFSLRDFLTSSSHFLTILRNLLELQEKYHPQIKAFLRFLIDSLSS